MAEIKNKWKRMAVDLHFSDYGDAAADWVYDQLMQCATEKEWDAAMENMDVDIWYPFEHMPWYGLRDSVESTAQTAQRYSEVPA